MPTTTITDNSDKLSTLVIPDRGYSNYDARLGAVECFKLVPNNNFHWDYDQSLMIMNAPKIATQPIRYINVHRAAVRIGSGSIRMGTKTIT